MPITTEMRPSESHVTLYQIAWREKAATDQDWTTITYHGDYRWNDDAYFKTGKAASAYLQQEKGRLTRCFTVAYTEYREVSFRILPRYITDPELVKQWAEENDWKRREATRLKNGTYTLLPWYQEGWWTERPIFEEHFAHVSEKNPRLVAFTANHEHGVADRQTRIALTTYLDRFYSNLAQHEREEIATRHRDHFGLAPELKFARTPDEIIDVYTNGPRSCMSHHADDFAGHMHPVAVYGDSPDLAVAYIAAESDSDEDQRITARAVVWPEKKRYSRLYGHESELKSLLVAAGYYSGGMEGARIRAIRDNNSQAYIMPYIDGGRACSEDPASKGAYLVIDSNGAISASETNGLSEERGWNCEHCEESFPEEECAITIEDRGWMVCESCADNHFVLNDADNCHYSELYASRHLARIDAGSYEGEMHPQDDTFTCGHSGNTYHDSDATTASDGELVARENLEDYESDLAEGRVEEKPAPRCPDTGDMFPQPIEELAPLTMAEALTLAPGEQLVCIDNAGGYLLTVGQVYTFHNFTYGWLRVDSTFGGWSPHRFARAPISHNATQAA